MNPKCWFVVVPHWNLNIISKSNNTTFNVEFWMLKILKHIVIKFYLIWWLQVQHSALIALIAHREHRSHLGFLIIRSNNIRKSELPFMFVNKKTEKGMGLTRAQFKFILIWTSFSTENPFKIIQTYIHTTHTHHTNSWISKFVIYDNSNVGNVLPVSQRKH